MKVSRIRATVSARFVRMGLAVIGLVALGAALRPEPDPLRASEPDAQIPQPEELAAGQDNNPYPRFTADGALERPEEWRMWPLAGASLGLSYNEEVGPMQHFHRVYTQPWAYEHARETGEFAEGTMFILEFYTAEDDSDPARAGHYEGERFPMFEVHVKNEDLHESGWGFYNFADTTAVADMISAEASCYSCHAAEADVDNVFVQFYPHLRERMGNE